MAAFDRRSFAGGAITTTVSPGIDGSTLTIGIADATGWPTGSAGNFFAVIDQGEASEEKVEIASRSGTTLTVAASGRGVDGTSAVSHSDGASIFHCLTARDLDEANEHVSDSRATAHAASKISYTAGGSLSSTNVNDAIDELEDDIAASVAGAGLLAVTAYNPAASTETTTTSGTFADVDATNMKVAFTAPASGSVLVRLTANAILSGTSGHYRWGLRESTADIGDPVRVADGLGGAWVRVSAAFLITGLTPGAAKTYKWAHATTADTGGVGYGEATPFHGPAIMEVWAAPA